MGRQCIFSEKGELEKIKPALYKHAYLEEGMTLQLELTSKRHPLLATTGKEITVILPFIMV